ncbi:unnamed protein product [Acanthoscelides obtectus]|uniref:Uncharacterized protein n=1 Tax=Acanthoscelides obtectus TaxID=200917 RepID=A0A9P0M4G9_ACAOB|nr:unnamed protein product [Acanthoscelides obtectus]CAK1664098.1 hypothetical protein AOBTE_LOCUS24050 [Acanthoscelides obtectus]
MMLYIVWKRLKYIQSDNKIHGPTYLL